MWQKDLHTFYNRYSISRVGGARQIKKVIMKKLLLVVVAAMMVGAVSAQEWQKNILGVRVGANVANMNVDLLDTKARVNAHVGVSYERQLLKNLPLYLETGLQLTNKGFKFEYSDWEEGTSTKTTATYLEVPVMVNYKFNIQDVVTVYPSAGFYYAYGIAGKSKATETYDGESESYEDDTFGDEGMKRSDVGFRVGVSAVWKQFVFGIGYEGGFTDLGGSDEEDLISIKCKNTNFFISVGYNF